MLVATGEPADRVTRIRTRVLNPPEAGVDSRVHRSDQVAVEPSAGLRIPETVHIAWKLNSVSAYGA
jgi:hypothetical protein